MRPTVHRPPGPGLLICALLGLAVSARPAGALELLVTIEPEALTVGDRAEIVLTLHGESDEIAGEPRFPAWGPTWGGAEIVDAGPVEPAVGAPAGGPPALYRQRLVVAAYRPGIVELPARRVLVPSAEAGEDVELSTPANLALRIDSVLPPSLADAEASAIDLRPPEPPRSLPLGAPFWASAATGTALLLGLVLLDRRRLRSAASAPAPPARDELAAALAAAGAAEPEAGHVQLSLALRRYLGRSFGFRAAESTTTEVRRQLLERRAPAAAAARSHEVLAACDRVKFAREPVTREALAARVDAAREIGRAVEAHLRPAVEADDAAVRRRREAA